MKEVNKITVAASKSYFQRALAISALAHGTSNLHNISWCNDSLSAKQIIENLGVKTIESDENLTVISSKIEFQNNVFNVGESGLGIRMFSPIFALNDKTITLTGEGSLKTRPVNIIVDALEQLSVKIKNNNGLLPLKIKGPIKAGKINIDGSLSSQLLTGLLIVLPLLNNDSEINVSNLKSTPYIDMTLQIMQDFGVEVENINYQKFIIKGKQKYKPINYNIEGDWSGGAFFLVYGAVKNSVVISNLDYASAQADKAIIDALKLAGAKITINNNSVKVEKDKLKSFKFDATACPDLFPPLVCLAAQCNEVSEIKGISRLTHKESNRAKTLQKEFAKIGIEIKLEHDSMYVKGGKLKACEIDSHNDHRIAMAGGLMNLFCDGEIKIINNDAINKSYPNFFNDLKKLN